MGESQLCHDLGREGGRERSRQQQVFPTVLSADLIHTGHQQDSSEGRSGSHDDVGDSSRVLCVERERERERERGRERERERGRERERES